MNSTEVDRWALASELPEPVLNLSEDPVRVVEVSKRLKETSSRQPPE